MLIVTERFLMKKISLKEWNDSLNRPKSMRTIYRWVEDGKIYPPPEKIGRDYEVDMNASYIDPITFNRKTGIANSLVKRIKDGR